MKTLITTISGLLIITFFGCSENQLTQPETTFNNSIEKTSSNKAEVCQPIRNGKIKLCCEINDPVFGNCNLQGSVTYIHTTLSNTGGLTRIQIGFEMKTELSTRMLHMAPYLILGCSCDTVYVIGTSPAIVEKNYLITNRPDTRLGVKYKVTTVGAEIIGARLHQIDRY